MRSSFEDPNFCHIVLDMTQVDAFSLIMQCLMVMLDGDRDLEGDQ